MISEPADLDEGVVYAKERRLIDESRRNSPPDEKSTCSRYIRRSGMSRPG